MAGALWEDFLQTGSYKGVEFDFVSVRDQFANILDIQSFPGRNGAFVQKRARAPMRIEVLAIFVEDSYPGRMNELLIKAVRDGSPGELVHPVFGSIMAAVESCNVTHDADDARDAGTVQLVFIEHTENADKVFKNHPTIPSRASETRSNAGQVASKVDGYINGIIAASELAASEALALSSDAYVAAVNLGIACNDAADAAAATADTLENDGDTMSAPEIQATVNVVLAEIETQIEALEDYTTTESYELSRSLLLTAASLGALAELLISQKPPLVSVMVEADIPLLAWVHAFYGDSSRVEEVLGLNSIPDPLLLPAGMLLRAYAV